MVIFDGKEYFDRKDYYKIMQEDILLNREILVRRLPPKNKKNLTNKIDNSLFILEENYNQEYGMNYHFVQHSYKNNIVKEENLIGVSTISFDIDIGENKECKSKSEFYTRLNILKKKYGIYPHLIVKTTGGYHIYFNLLETFEYKIYKKAIDKVYTFLISELLGDKGFKWKISQLKVIGSYDRSNKYTDPEQNGISIEKYNKHNKYTLKDLYNLYEKITGIKKDLIDDEKNAEKSKERNRSFRYKINELCPYKVSKDLGIYDSDRKCIKGDNSIKIWYDKNIDRYCIKEHNGSKIDLYQIILNHFKGDFKELVKYIYKEYSIKYNNESNYFEIPKIILKEILSGEFLIDYDILKEEFGENYKELLSNISVLNYGKLNYKILFILINLLTFYNKETKNIILKDINIFDIFRSSNEKKDNLYVNKQEYILYFKIMKSLYINLENFNTNQRNINKIYLIDDFTDKGNNKYDIKILNKMLSKGYIHKLKNIPAYIPNNIFKLDKKIMGAFILFLIKSEIENIKQKSIKYEDIYKTINKSYNDKYLRKIKSEVKNIFKEIKKNIRINYRLYLEKNEVIIEKE
ncbi:MAG: hypothetical protein PHR68_04055 [Candidatus Gracilibacteria bacterium]|nr:hypothetical protein [Candidatus Gracilibacteria bacterium]